MNVVYKASGLAFNPETRTWNKPVEYAARDRQEAINWAKFNQDYLTDIRIDGDGVSIPFIKAKSHFSWP